jgi:hypothetical protein
MDQKVRAVMMRYGGQGFGALVYLWQNCYDNGYYLETDDIMIENISLTIHADAEWLLELIGYCCKWSIFNAELWESDRVLTSTGIQKRYREAAKRRSGFCIRKYDLSGVSVDENSVNVYNNPVNVDKSTQSKVNKSKVKEKGVAKTLASEYPKSIKLFYEILGSPSKAQGKVAALKAEEFNDDTISTAMENFKNLPQDEKKFYSLYEDKIGDTISKLFAMGKLSAVPQAVDDGPMLFPHPADGKMVPQRHIDEWEEEQHRLKEIEEIRKAQEGK